MGSGPCYVRIKYFEFVAAADFPKIINPSWWKFDTREVLGTLLAEVCLAAKGVGPVGHLK